MSRYVYYLEVGGKVQYFADYDTAKVVAQSESNKRGNTVELKDNTGYQLFYPEGQK